MKTSDDGGQAWPRGVGKRREIGKPTIDKSAEITALKKALAIAITALEFYEAHVSYTDGHDTEFCAALMNDGGKRAAEAIRKMRKL